MVDQRTIEDRSFPYDVEVIVDLYDGVDYKSAIFREAKSYTCGGEVPNFEFSVDIENKSAIVSMGVGCMELTYSKEEDPNLRDLNFKYCDARATSVWGSETGEAAAIIWFDPKARFIHGEIRVSYKRDSRAFFGPRYRVAPSAKYCAQMPFGRADARIPRPVPWSPEP